MNNGHESSVHARATVINVPRKPLDVEEEQAKAMVNFIQVQNTEYHPALTCPTLRVSERAF